jgi:hypothetical protein
MQDSNQCSALVHIGALSTSMHEWKPHDTSARKHVLKVLTAPILLQSFTLTTSLECPHQMLPVPIGHERVFHASRVKGFCRDSACPGSGAITVLSYCRALFQAHRSLL